MQEIVSRRYIEYDKDIEACVSAQLVEYILFAQ